MSRDEQVAAQTAPCGCKWYADGTSYKCLSHRPSPAALQLGHVSDVALETANDLRRAARRV